MEQRCVLVIPSGCTGEKDHVHVATVSHLAQLRRELVGGKEPSPELCRLPQHVPLRDRHGHLSTAEVREVHGDVLRRVWHLRSENAGVPEGRGHVEQARIVLGRDRSGILE